eukprot:5673174-Pyramimonas_sp.AAC.1
MDKSWVPDSSQNTRRPGSTNLVNIRTLPCPYVASVVSRSPHAEQLGSLAGNPAAIEHRRCW